MGDQEDGFAPALLMEGFQDHGLVEAVQVGGGLVQEQEGGVVEKGPGQAQPLPLPAGEGVPQLADLRIVALGEAHDEVVDRRLFAGGGDLLVGGVQPGKAEVAADGVVEQVGLLGDEALHVPEIGRVDLLHASAGEGDGPLGHGPEPHQQL